MAPQGHFAVHVNDAALIVQQMCHQLVHVLGDDLTLRLVSGQVVIDRVAVKHRVEVVHAHVAVPAVIGEFALPLMPFWRVLAVALPTLHRAVSLDVAAREQPGLAGDLLLNP